MFAFEAARAARGAGARCGGDNAQGERYLPDVLPILRARADRPRPRDRRPDGAMLGINDRVALAQATALAQRRIHERHMLAGVTIVDPDATVIDADVEIGAGHRDRAVHEPARQHRDRRTLPDRPARTLIDSRVADGATSCTRT